MKKWAEIALGVITSIGGFLEVGSIATAAQAGASFRFQLIWPIALGTICVIFLIEMSGRLAAVSHHPLPAAVRERFGINFAVVPCAAETVVDFLVLATEIAGAERAAPRRDRFGGSIQRLCLITVTAGEQRRREDREQNERPQGQCMGPHAPHIVRAPVAARERA